MQFLAFVVFVVVLFIISTIAAAVQVANDKAPVGYKIKCPCCRLMDLDVVSGHLPPDNPYRTQYEVISTDPLADLLANTVCDAFENRYNQGKRCKLAICVWCNLKTVVDDNGQCTLYPGWPQPNPPQWLDEKGVMHVRESS